MGKTWRKPHEEGQSVSQDRHHMMLRRDQHGDMTVWTVKMTNGSDYKLFQRGEGEDIKHVEC